MSVEGSEAEGRDEGERRELSVAYGSDWRTFLLLWAGLSISWVGSHLTGFAAGLTVFQDTGSATWYGVLSFALLMPEGLLAPAAGVLVDRWDRRTALLVSQVGGALCTGLLAWLTALGPLDVIPAVLLLGTRSCLNAFLIPALSASIPLLVPESQLGRANSLIQLGFGLAQLVAPAMAGSLMPIIGLQGVVMVDVASFLCAVMVLLLLKLPRPPRRGLEPRDGKVATVRSDFWQEAREGWAFLAHHLGLQLLLAWMSLINFSMGMASILFTPLVLSFADGQALGWVLSVGGVGMMLGSLVMLAWGGPKRQLQAVLGFSFLQGLVYLLAALRPSLPLAALGAFGGMFCIPIVSSAAAVVWQKRVPLDLQGRVFALRTLFANSAFPAAMLLAGPLSDRVFEPLLMPGGALSISVGPWLGLGPGRGSSLIFLLLGVFTMLGALLMALLPSVRRLDAPFD